MHTSDGIERVNTFMAKVTSAALPSLYQVVWEPEQLVVLLDAASRIRFSSEPNFSGKREFSLGVNMGSDSTPPKLFWVRV